MPIALGSAYGAIEINTQGAENSISGLASMLKETGTTLSLGISAPLLGVATSAIKTAADFEENMNIMKAVSGATADQMKLLEAQALKLGADTVFSASEAAQGMLELSKAGLSVNDTMQAIPGVLDLAAAGGLGVGQAAEIASNALNTFHLPASKAGEVANLFAAAANASSIEVTDMAQSMAQAGSVAASYGQSIETAATAIAIMGNNGLKGSDAGTSLKTMLSRLAAPTEESAALMKQLGVNVYDASGKMRPLNEIMVDLQKGLHGTMTVTEKNAGATSANSKQAQHYLNIINQTKQKLADYQSGVAGVAQSENAKKVAIDRLNRTLAAAQAEYQKLGGVQASTTTKTVKMTDEMRNQALYTLFGSDAIRAANILLKEGETGWDNMAEAVNKEGAAQTAAQARMQGFNGAIKYLSGSIDSFYIATVKPFLDTLAEYPIAFADFVTSLSGVSTEVRNAALAFLAVLAVAGPVLLAITGIGTVLGALLSPIGLIILGIGVLAAAWASDFGGIREKTAAAWAAIQPVLTQLWTMLQGQLVSALVALGAWWAGVWPQIQSATLAAWAALQPSLTQLWTMLQTSLPAALTLLQTWFNTAWTAINTAVSTALATTGPLLTQFWTWLQVSLPLALTTLQSWFATAWASMTGSVTTASSTISGVFATLQSAWNTLAAIFGPSIARLGQSLLSFGEQAGGLGGHFQGLMTAVQSLWTAIQPILTQLGILIGITIGVVAVTAINALSAVFQNLGPIISASVDQVTNILNTLATVITATVALVVALIHGDWTTAWEQAKTIVTTLGTFMQTSLANFATVIGASFAIIGATISNTLKDLGFEAAGEMVSAFTEKITALVDWVSKLVSGDVSLNLQVPAWIEALTAWVWPELVKPDWLAKLLAWAWPDKAPNWMNSFINWTWPSTPREVIGLIGWKFPDVPQPIKDIITWVWPDAPQVISDLLDWEFPDVPKAIDNLLNFQWPDLTTPDWIKSFVDAINSLINWSMPDMNPFNAGGNSYFMGGMTHLNERGRELVAIPADQAILPTGSRIYTNGQANRMLAGAGGEGGGNLVNIEKVYVANQQDVHALAWQIDNLRRRSAGR